METRFLGRKVRLETCSKCQLKCPSCATPRGDTRAGAVGWGGLTPESLTQFLNTAGPIRSLEISNWGEIFLNRRLGEILQVAYVRQVPVTAANGVNLNTATEEMLEAVVRYRVREMTVSIDGATQESYARYRINGRLDRVLANVDRINEHKRSLNSEFPHLTWQYIVFGHNAHEIEAARTLAQERDMKFQAIRNLDANYSPLQDPALAERRTGIRYAIDTDEVLDELADGLGFCHQVWDAPQVNWNGDLLGCCFNYKRAFGNALKTPLPRLLDGKDYRYLKQMLTGRAPMRHDMPCADCRFYPRRLQ